MSIFANTIDGNDIYAKRAEQDKDGNPIRSVPPTGVNEHRGQVLTVNDSDEAVWAPASGGGGGGNPYTRVSVTPGAPYPNTDGRSSYGWTYDDQDVVISNNTYSVLDTAVGNGNGTDVGETACVDMLNIKLPEGTDFPMAVVEFVVSNNYGNGVNNIRVFVGSSALTRMYEAPYASNNLMTDSYKTLGYNTLDTQYDIIRGISDSNLSSYNNAYLGATRVQVHIFGNCFKVMVNKDTGEPAAS
jgi:hypothetical protein